MSDGEEKTPTVSPDQGATGETTTSFENKEAHYKEEYDNTVFKVLENIIMQAPKASWDTWLWSLLKHFAMANQSKRSEKPYFLNLDELEALKTEHLENSGHVPHWLHEDMNELKLQEEFEGYLKLLRETRDCFGHGIECIVMRYIISLKGEGYYQNLCMSCYKEK